MNITKNDIDSLNSEIKISLTPADYENRVNDALKKVQRQASMPGFRPGKVPAGLIKKQYGTQIMVDEINKLLNETIYKTCSSNFWHYCLASFIQAYFTFSDRGIWK